MKIHKEGRTIVFGVVIFCLAFISIIAWITAFDSLSSKIAGTMIVLMGSFVAYFFRNPYRPIQPDQSLIYAPADGRIVDIEHQSIVIETPDGILVLVRQIAGFLARRIICYAKVGEKAIQGNDIGFIRFGSRVDMYLPINTEILVKMNEKVKGNKTIITRLKQE
jgi:phosphatidylserine decarboxylase